jgi:predicted metal-binding membrane protein
VAEGTKDARNPQLSERGFQGICALLFVMSAAVTVAWCASMSSMGGMPMPGGWTMSMAWMRMPGQSWPGAAASFLGMWTVMMFAMMLPALVPMLGRYRLATDLAAGARLDRLTLRVGAAYFVVWMLAGAILFPLGVAFAALAMQSPALARGVPLAAALVVIASGALQLTRWKSRQLARCRDSTGRGVRLTADARTAWQHGARLGLQCSRCCAGSTAILLALGVMDLAVMAVVTLAISLERLSPAGWKIARGIGAAVIAMGLFLLASALDA